MPLLRRQQVSASEIGAWAQVFGRFAEVVGQVKVTKSYGAEVRELEKFGRHYTNTVEITRPQSRWWHSMDTARGVAMNLIFLAIYLILFTRTLDGHFTVGEMVMLIQMVTMARQPVTMMSWIVDSAQRAIAGSRDYFKVMDEPVEPTANRQLVEATKASGMLRASSAPISSPAGIPGATRATSLAFLPCFEPAAAPAAKASRSATGPTT